MTKAFVFAACGLALFTTACLHPKIGPQSLPRDRSLYSVSLADSWKDLTLLNIVKVRYLDPPVYVDIGNIVSSYTLTQGASVGGTINPPRTSSAAVLGGAVTLVTLSRSRMRTARPPELMPWFILLLHRTPDSPNRIKNGAGARLDRAGHSPRWE
jgi:hypothetical protein